MVVVLVDERDGKKVASKAVAMVASKAALMVVVMAERLAVE